MTLKLIWVYGYVFFIGMCIASFINVVAYRMPRGISVVKGRSFCSCCKHKLSAFDLIPVMSYLMLKGRCRYCRNKISPREPLIELLGGLLALLCVHHYGFAWMSLLSFALAMILSAISLIDYDSMIIPDRLNLCILFIAFIRFFVSDIEFIERFIGFFAVSVPMIALNCILHESFGGGDIKLTAFCGLLIGYRDMIIGIIMAVLTAGIYATVLVLKKKANRRDHIAFGPYICTGVFVSLLYGEQIMQMYLNLFI